MGKRIHWGVFNALRDAADSFIKEERENIEFLKERLHFADAEGNNAVHLEKNIESAVQRVDEVEKFKECLTDAELQGDVEGLLDDNVRTWLLLGLNQLSDTSKWSKEFISSEEWRLDNGLTPDGQLFMFQAHRLLRRLPEVISDAEAGKLAADVAPGRKVKLQPEVFEREIYPILDKEFPLGGENKGIIRRCDEIGKRYDVSGSTIKKNFYDMRYEINRGNTGL